MLLLALLLITCAKIFLESFRKPRMSLQINVLAITNTTMPKANTTFLTQLLYMNNYFQAQQQLVGLQIY